MPKLFNYLEHLRNDPMTETVIGFTSGVFDMLHTGHIIMLQEAKAHCDILIVGLLTDPTISRPTKNKPVQSTFERYVQLQAVDGVAHVVPFDTEEDLVNILYAVKPHIRFVGEEYKGTKHTGCDIPGIKIIYNRREHNYSSTNLRLKTTDKTVML